MRFDMFDENRWAYEDEFKENLLCHKMLDDNLNESGVPLYAENNTVYVDAKDSHTLIFGNTGSKKTRNFCIPSVYTIGSAGESMVISDPKGEIYNNTSGFLKAQGYDVMVINLRQPDFGIHWNPLTVPYRLYKNGCKDKACEMVSDFCNQLKEIVHSDKEPYWENSAADVLMGILIMIFECAENENQVNLKSVAEFRSYVNPEDDRSKSGPGLFWELLETFPQDSIIRYKLNTIASIKSSEKTFACIMSMIDTMLGQFLLQENVLEMLSVSDLDYDKFLSRKSVLYIIMPDEKSTFHFLVSAFVKQFYEYMIYSAQIDYKGCLPVRVNFILDEFANISRIKDMSSMISAARSRNIRFLLIVQSRQQLFSLYQNDADTIRSNCRNWIFLSCREKNLLDEVEQLCGTVYIEGRGYRPLMSVSAFQQLRVGWHESQALVLRPQIRPFITKILDFSLYPQSDFKSEPLSKHEIVKCEILSLRAAVQSRIANEKQEYDFMNIDELFVIED